MASLYDGNVSVYTDSPQTELPGAEEITTNVIVTCHYDDDNDRDGLRENNVTITLLASDGSSYQKNMRYINGGRVEFDGLIRSIDGKEVTYELTADLPGGYRLASTGSEKTEDGNIEISAEFYHKPATKSIRISKTWDDKDDVDGIRPESITVKLTGSDGSSFTKKLYANNNWTATADNLYACYDHGKEMKYTVEEVSVDGYTGTVEETSDGNFELTNVHTQELRTLTVTAAWNDDDNRDGIRPDSIKVVLTGSDGSKSEGVIKKSDDWEYEFKNIPVNADGTAISYSLSQTVPEGYTGKVTVAQGTKGFVVTNTHTVSKQDITVKQIWSDDNNRDGIRPDRLKAALKGSDGEEYTLKLSEDNDWTVTFKNLPVYYSSGKKISYSLSEITASGYSTTTQASSDGLSYTVTNTHSPERRDITVYKKWNDSNDADGLRKDVSLTLTGSDGSKYTGKILKDSADQEYVFKNLYCYANGEEIKYSIAEQEMAGYTAKIAEAKDGFTITNTHAVSEAAKQEDDEADSTDKWTADDDASDDSTEKVIGVPKTGDAFYYVLFSIMGLAAVLAGVGTYLHVKRRGDGADE